MDTVEPAVELLSVVPLSSAVVCATMASKRPNQAAKFEPSVSMNDQNCRVFSCLAFDQSGLMQHSRTGGKVPWNALPALINEDGDQNSEAGIFPSRQKGSPVDNAPRLMSQLICPCTFSIALAWLSLTCLLSSSLRRWGRSRNHFLRFFIMYGIITKRTQASSEARDHHFVRVGRMGQAS